MENIKEYIPRTKYYSNNIHTLGKYQNISQKILMKMTCELIFKTPVYSKNSFHIDTEIFSNFLYGYTRNINKEIYKFRINDTLQNCIYNIYQFKKYYPDIEYLQEDSKIYVLNDLKKYSIREFDNLYLQNKLFFYFPIKIVKKKNSIINHELVIILTVGNIEIAIDILNHLLNNYQNIFLALTINKELELNRKLLALMEQFDNYIIYQTSNYGFDITPFLHTYYYLKTEIHFDYIFKIHTKSDPEWRNSLLKCFYQTKWGNLKKKLGEDYVGICSSQNLIYNSHFNLHVLNKHFTNFDNNYKFVQGTIFLVEKKYIECIFKEDYKYLLKGLTYHSFYSSNYLFFKNSPSHSIERIFGFEIYKNNKKYYTI